MSILKKKGEPRAMQNPNRKEVLLKIHEEDLGNDVSYNGGSFDESTVNQSKMARTAPIGMSRNHQEKQPSYARSLFTKDFLNTTQQSQSSHVGSSSGKIRITASNYKAASLRQEVGILKSRQLDLPVDETDALLSLNNQN